MRTITMNGPGKNCLGTTMMTFLLDELEKAKNEPVLLTGANDAFSAGLDLKEVASLDEGGMYRFLELLERCMTALYLHPAPTVAAVNGHAIAGGSVLTICCDHRVVKDNPKIKLGLNEVALGVRYPPRVFAIVRARVPPRSVAEVVLGAGLHDPQSALRLGLVDEIAPDEMRAASNRLEALAAHPREAYALAKRDLRGTASDLCDDATQAAFLREATKTWTSPDVKRKVLAVLGR